MPVANKVTYVTLSADSDDVHLRFDEAIGQVHGQLGQTYPLHVAGTQQAVSSTISSTSPADTRVIVGHVASADERQVNDAVAAAKAASAAWRAIPWRTRADHLRRVAAGVRAERFELATWAVVEMGKNRLEALGEVEELADLIDYYIDQMELNHGYEHRMASLSPADTNTSVLRPYGVWAVVSPWNFPYALLGAPVAAALLTGNVVVAKPSSETPVTAHRLAAVFDRAGLPPGTFTLLTGSGRMAGDTLVHHPDVDGITFTGSYEVGYTKLFKGFSRTFPKPCIAEMGGKNPALVMDSADLDRAVAGVYRSAFGMNGHKCSACSRVYVHEAVAQTFLDGLVRKVAETRIGDPLLRTTFVGPLATQASRDDYLRFVAQARADGRIEIGGALLDTPATAHGYFAAPTVVTGLPPDHTLNREELFVPILVVTPVKSLTQALAYANDSVFGLTAGLFSQRPEEIDAFLDGIEAGVVYVNRAAGATTGAWPGVQPFGGWKGSGSSGKNIGGLYSLLSYMREQSRTVTS